MLDRLRYELRERSRERDDGDFMLRGLWTLQHHYRPNQHERLLTYGMVLAQTRAQGCCYTDIDALDIDVGLLDSDVRDLEPEDLPQRIAILDAGFAMLPRNPSRRLLFSGATDEKAVERANIIVDEVVGHLARRDGRRILNIGVMGNFFPHLRRHGIEILATDFDREVIENAPGHVTVLHGAHTLDLIKDVDLVLATGMTLATGTLPEIIEECRRRETVLVLFAATGSFLAETYCRKFGVDAVISEPQPQYIFQGISSVEIYHKA